MAPDYIFRSMSENDLRLLGRWPVRRAVPSHEKAGLETERMVDTPKGKAPRMIRNHHARAQRFAPGFSIIHRCLCQQHSNLP
jgi:hypothetical protein